MNDENIRVLRELRNGFLRTPEQLEALEAAIAALRKLEKISAPSGAVDGSRTTTPVVDEAMVQRALLAPYGGYSVCSFIPLKSPTNIYTLMHAALTGALSATSHA